MRESLGGKTEILGANTFLPPSSSLTEEKGQEYLQRMTFFKSCTII